MTIYRKIYKTFYGSIPKDQDGRTYDIHHIDGDKTNNSILNLVALSLQDHYDVHYIQGDYGACYAMARRMKLSSEDLSEICRAAALQQIQDGKSVLVGKSGSEFQRGQVKLGRNIFGNKQWQKDKTTKQIENGTFFNMISKTCPKCNKTMNPGQYKRWGHGENCKPKYYLISPTNEVFDVYSFSDVENRGLFMRHLLKNLGYPLQHGKNKGWKLVSINSNPSAQ